METATLFINDTQAFDNAVFQMQTGNTPANYEGWLKDVAKTLDSIKKIAETSDAITSEEEYTLGDVINFLETISVRCGGRTNPITEDFWNIQEWLDTTIDEVCETMETQCCKIDDDYALVLTMESDFCESGYEYERTDEDGTVWAPCVSLRYYCAYGSPEDWQYVRVDDNPDASPLADYVISDQNELAEVLDWMRKDLDGYFCIKS